MKFEINNLLVIYEIIIKAPYQPGRISGSFAKKEDCLPKLST